MAVKQNPQSSDKSVAAPGSSAVPGKPWYLYLLGCADGTMYTGITTDPRRRLKEHNAGRGARYTAQRQRRPVRLLGVWRFPDRASATGAEIRFKQRGPKRKRQVAFTRVPVGGAPFCSEFFRDEKS